jgi:hypothetical protein
MVMGRKDPSSNEGASALATRIVRYWRDRGFDVAVDVEPAGYTQQMRSGYFVVRSDLRNGMPSRKHRTRIVAA